MQHGQKALYTPLWDDLGEYSEPVIIEEVMGDGRVAIRYEGDDMIITVSDHTLDNISGEPCQCRN